MSMLRVVGRGVAWNTASSFVVKFVAIANIFLILSRLSVYEYGVVQLIISAFSTIAAFLLPGLVSSVIADLARTREEGRTAHASALARHYFVMQAALGIIGFCILFFGANLVGTYLDLPHVGDLLSIISLLFLVNPFMSMVNMLANVELRFKLQSGLSVLDEAAKFLWLLLFFYVFGLGPAGVLWAMVLAPLTVFIIALPWTFSLIKPLMKRVEGATVPFLEVLAPHRRWGIASSYIGTINQNARIWIIQLFLGTESVGLYSFAQGLVSQTTAILTFSQIANPLIARAAVVGNRLANFTNRVFKYHLWLGILAIPFATLATPFFVQWFFPEYAPAILVTVIILLTLIPSAASIASSGAYPALMLQKEFFRAMVLKLLLTVFMLPLLVFKFGLIGAAVEIVITNTISVFERTRALRKRVPGFLSSVKDVVSIDDVDRSVAKRILVQVRLQLTPSATKAVK